MVIFEETTLRRLGRFDRGIFLLLDLRWSIMKLLIRVSEVEYVLIFGLRRADSFNQGLHWISEFVRVVISNDLYFVNVQLLIPPNIHGRFSLIELFGNFG
jgi:hypothetical protein